MASLDTIIRILELLGPIILNEVNLHLKSREEAQTLESNLKKIKQWLGVAESRQLKDRLIKDWLESVQDVAYDIEDVLEEWEAKRKLQQLQYEEDQKQTSPSNLSMWEKVSIFAHSPLSCFNQFSKNRTIALNIKGLNVRVENIYEEGLTQLQLNQYLTDATNTTTNNNNNVSRSSSNWRTTTSAYIKSEVCRRENDVAKLKEMLELDGEVICIVGQGGLGKTTLAKMVFDDNKVKSQFPGVRIWVCVSDPFDEKEIAKNILEQLKVKSADIPSTDQALLQMVKDCLGDKKFLLVLDDVWTEKPEEWERLKAYIISDEGGGQGSKILVTTRKEQTAKVVGTAERSYHLERMTDEECWSIISRIALSGRNQDDYLTVQEVGREIAKKCDGLPLAARFLGGLLEKKEISERDWQRVLESEIWELKGVDEQLFRHIFLSYDELDPTVKRCFSYCALFPKDFRIHVGDLIKMWMAQGFISSSSSSTSANDEVEAEGYSYFKDLAQRSFFQDLEFDVMGETVFHCKMHDIVHDFAQYLSRSGSHAPPRHLWSPRGQEPLSGDMNAAKKLRSLFCSNVQNPKAVFRKVKCVRALSLGDCGLEEIPEEIRNLIHLRYLDLSWNGNMKKLPESICNLHQLQTLVLKGCGNLTKFPQSFFSNLRNLRYLLTDNASLNNLWRETR